MEQRPCRCGVGAQLQAHWMYRVVHASVAARSSHTQAGVDGMHVDCRCKTADTGRSALMGSAAEHQVKIADIERTAAETLRQHALDADELRQEIADMRKHLASREGIKSASPAMKKALQEGTLQAGEGADSRGSSGNDTRAGGRRRTGKRNGRGRGGQSRS
eukprot:m.709509 g.709509  ORF g.709509 m.709509 type:complete len:161 (+) comp22945_c0_seq2:2520-3002(+)